MMSEISSKKPFLGEKEMDGGGCSRNKINCMLTYRYMEGLLYYCLYPYEYNLFGNAPPPKKNVFFK